MGSVTCQFADCGELIPPSATECSRGHPYNADADEVMPPIRIVRAPAAGEREDSGSARARLVQLKINGQAQSVPIDDPIVIGRGRGTAVPDLFADCPNVSRQHLRVVAHGSGFLVTDLGSLNGTYLAGRRIESEVTISDPGTVRLACNRELHLALVPVGPNRFSR